MIAAAIIGRQGNGFSGNNRSGGAGSNDGSGGKESATRAIIGISLSHCDLSGSG